MPRRPLSRPLLVTLVLLSTALPTVAARAAIPGGDDPKAFTQHDYLRLELEFNRRTLTGEYDRVGHHDPAWDEMATRFLDAVAVYFAYGPADRVYKDVTPAPKSELLAMASAATDAGCDDPLVLYCQGAMMHDSGNSHDAIPILARALRGMTARKYPPRRIAPVAGRLARIYARGTTPEQKKYVAQNQKLAWDMTIAALARKPDEKDLRHVLVFVDDVFEPLTTPRKLEFCQAVERTRTASPWIINLLYGRYEIKAAWEARGSGWANTVTDEGWRGLYEHLTKARDYLTKAHALHPEFPEAAAQMITVAMAAGDRLNDTPRDWFDKAARAQFDYYPAYHALTYAMLPRWGGTHPQMFRFGQECVATNRFDTDVPYHLMRIVRWISGDNEDADPSGLQVLAVPQVYAAVDKLFTTLVAKAIDPALKARYASEHLAVAWRAGHYDAAAALMDAYDGRVDFKPFTDLLAWAPGALSEVRLMTSAQAREAAAAAEQARAGNFAAARDAYAKIVDTLPGEHPGQFFARHRRRAMEIQAAVAATTDWVPLTPAGADLAPWTVVSGDFTLAKDGAIEVTSDEKAQAILLCRVDLGPAYEIRATVETVKSPKPSFPSIYVNWWQPRSYGAAGLANDLKTANAHGYNKNPSQPIEITGPAVLGARVEGDHFTVTVNDKPVLTDLKFNPYMPAHDTFAGIGVRGVVAGSVTRFSKIEVRRITTVKQP